MIPLTVSAKISISIPLKTNQISFTVRILEFSIVPQINENIPPIHLGITTTLTIKKEQYDLKTPLMSL